MSAQHHSEAEQHAQKRMLQEFLNEAKPSYPQGKLNADDHGEISFAVAADLRNRVIILRCAKPVDWLGLNVEAARHLAKLLNEKADQIEASTVPKRD